MKVIECYQMLGEIAPDLMDAIGVDVAGITRINNAYGFPRDELWRHRVRP